MEAMTSLWVSMSLTSGLSGGAHGPLAVFMLSSVMILYVSHLVIKAVCMLIRLMKT